MTHPRAIYVHHERRESPTPDRPSLNDPLSPNADETYSVASEMRMHSDDVATSEEARRVRSKGAR